MNLVKRNKSILSLIFIALLATGCSNENQLASVNGESVTDNEFNAYLELKRITPKDEAHRQALLDQYLEREALAAVIDEQETLDKDTLEAELNEFRKEMLISRYFDTWLADKVTDEAVLNYYNTHASDYENNRVHVAHILFRTNANMSETERKAKLTTAQEAYSKIRAGLSFEEAARTYSEDKVSGKKGGDLGWLTQGSVSKQFSDKIFSLKDGEVTEPFETNFGFHIVKHLEGPTVVKQPFDSVKGRIRHQLRTEAKDAEMKRLLSEISINKE